MNSPPPPPPAGKAIRPLTRVEPASNDAEFVLLVIDADCEVNWAVLFKNCTGPNGRRLRVEQTEWCNITAHVDETGCRVIIAPSKEPLAGTNQKNTREITPDFLLIRQFVRGIHGQHWIPTLLCFMVANLPSVNSLNSIFFSTERATSIAELRRIQLRLGKDFPLVPMQFYPNVTASAQAKSFPLVAKVGTSCAGYGKMKFADEKEFGDFASTMAMFTDYVTIEPLLPNTGDLRIQIIGEHIRAFRRMNSNWKGNVGESTIEEVPVTELYERWAKEVRQMWGGLDICSIDCVVAPDGELGILEVNDTATGVCPLHKAEDIARIRDLVVSKWQQPNNVQ